MKEYPLYTTECIRDLKELTDTSVRRFSDKDAFRFMTDKTHYKSVTYGQFGADLAALAEALIDGGFAGGRIALIGENSYVWVLSYFAAVNSNSTVVPLDKELTKEEILSLLKRSGATVFIHSKAYQEEANYVSEAIPGLFTVSFDDGVGANASVPELIRRGAALIDSGTNHYANIEIDRQRACAILFTSGTTGKSKGVMLTHTAIAADFVSACNMVRYTKDDVMLSVLPVHHSYEAVAGIFSPILRGCTIAFCESTKLLPACLKLFSPTVMVLVPLYVETFLGRIWDSAEKQGKKGKLKFGVTLGNILAAVKIDIRRKLLADVHTFFGGRLVTIISGGAYLNPALVKEFRDLGIKVLQGYGTTECSPIIAVNRNFFHKDKSVGPVLPCCSVRIDEEGQILVRGSNVMLGYLDDRQATEDVFDDGWYKTGDFGHIDNDGFLYVTGRCSDLIVLKNGKNIMPAEIETLIGQSPLVAEVVVKAAPADAGGVESLTASIFPDETQTQGMDKYELRHAVAAEVDKVNQRLAYYKRIKEFTLRNSAFPKTSTKKIMRYKV